MMRKTDKVGKFTEKQKVTFSILLALIALVSATAATVAWFSIADFTRVSSMNIDITAGTNLRFDLDAHSVFEEYVRTLHFSQIADRIKRDRGIDIRVTPLEPVTTKDADVFTSQNGAIVDPSKGSYMEFTLHFMATDDMIVHLTSANSKGANDGTKVQSPSAQLPQAMRIAFTVGGQTWVYDPGMGDESEVIDNMLYFGLGNADNMVLSEKNKMFALKKDVDLPVKVRIWLEGNDPACTDQLRSSEYAISMRFIGTDENNRILDGSK